MKSLDYLFPQDLKVSDSQLNNILVIGSCLSEQYLAHFHRLRPDLHIDYTHFNNLMNLPQLDAAQASGYQLQYIQIPLRTVLGDHIVRITDFEKSANFEAIEHQAKSMLGAVLNAVMKYNREHGLLTLVPNFLLPQQHLSPSLAERGGARDFGRLVRTLNAHLDELLAGYANAYVADVDSLAATFGKRFFMDDVASFYAHNATLDTDVADFDNLPAYSRPNRARIEDVADVHQTYGLRTGEFSELILGQIEALYRIARQLDTVKIVIFDLDNTLWRGQIAEHYEPGAEWPVSHFWPVGLWEAVQHLRRRGIIVSLCSKNDEHIVRERWSRAVPLPWMRYDDFLLPKINWLPKSENIRDTLAALSLTAKSAVFVDDNPVERDEVARNIPGIRVIGNDPYQTRRILLWAPETQRSHMSAEALQRENSYKDIIEREKEKSGSGSREAFLAGLDVRLSFHLLQNQEDPAFQRINELINKTNQFNTTGVRWSGADFAQFFGNGGVIHAFSVRDKFSDYGLVGAILLQGGVIRQFTMSCRVLGMDVELAALGHVAGAQFAEGAQLIVGALVETELNTPCRDVFTRAGFAAPGQPGVFVLRRADAGAQTPHILVDHAGA